MLSSRGDSFGHIFYHVHEFEGSSVMNFIDNALPEGIVNVRSSFSKFISDLNE